MHLDTQLAWLRQEESRAQNILQAGETLLADAQSAFDMAAEESQRVVRGAEEKIAALRKQYKVSELLCCSCPGPVAAAVCRMIALLMHLPESTRPNHSKIAIRQTSPPPLSPPRSRLNLVLDST